MRYWGMVVVLIAFISSSFAQDAEATFISMSAVESVEIINEPEMPVLVIRGTLPTGCSYPVEIAKTRTALALFVDVYQEMSAAAICPMMVLPFEVRVPILELMASAEGEHLPQYLIVNEQNFGVTYAEVDASEMDTVYPLVALTSLVRRETSIENVTYEDVEGMIHLVISGQIGDGCTDPLITRWTREIDAANLVTISVSAFRLLVDPAECPLVFAAIPFEERIETNIPSQYSTLVIASEQRFPREVAAENESLPDLETIPTGINLMKVPHIIENVQYRVLESSPMQIHVEVSGYQSDGCNVPVQVMQQRVANTIKIEIFRDLSPDMMCPQVIQSYSATIPLSGSFESGSYMLDVNGTTVTIDL